MQLPVATCMYCVRSYSVLMCMQLFVCNIYVLCSYVAIIIRTFNSAIFVTFSYIFLQASQKHIANFDVGRKVSDNKNYRL